MHHISVRIIDDTYSEDSADEFTEFLDEGTGDTEIFMQLWKQSDQIGKKNPRNVNEEPISAIKSAYKHMKEAVSDITVLRTLFQNASSQKGVQLATVNHSQVPASGFSSPKQLLEMKVEQLDSCANFLLNSAEELKASVSKNRSYFRELDELSKKVPLTTKTHNNSTCIAIDVSNYPNESILLRQNEDSVEWALSFNTSFSFNGKSFQIATQSQYLKFFFDLMCHNLFERIKNDRIKSCIHYSADNQSRSIYFDIGNKDTWIFEIGQKKELADIPIWIPKLINLITNPRAQPAAFLKQLLYFHSTLVSVRNAIFNRFINNDFCTITYKFQSCLAAFQISSPHLQLPFLAYIDRWRVALTETPNEMRSLQYSTDGRGLAPALEKWCDATYTALFLSTIEKVTRGFGYVFKNKNQYGTAAIDGKKIRFKPIPKESDVEITITARKTEKLLWKSVPGSDYIEKISILLFNDQ